VGDNGKTAKILLKINELQRCDENLWPFLFFLNLLYATFALPKKATGLAVVLITDPRKGLKQTE
jgi:hypothetical protein